MIESEGEDLLIRARHVYTLLREKAPPIALREVLEALMGLKCSRLNVWKAGLEQLQALAREFNFGIAVSEWKMVPTLDAGKGDWSDGVLEYVPLNDPRGLFSAYLGSTKEEAISALRTEGDLGDEAFGELLGIPSCCRRFYSECRERASSANNDYLWETLSDAQEWLIEPAGANVVGQYFGRCLLSHFPCSLQCLASRAASAARRSVLSQVAPQLIDYLAEGHYWPALVFRGRGMVTYPGATSDDTWLRPRLDTTPQVIGDVPDEFASADRIFIDADGYIVAQRGERPVGRLPRSRARLVTIADTW